MENLYQKTVKWIQQLVITQGTGAGEPMVLWPWEKKFLKGLLDPATQTAALSVGRGNGKTAFLAAIAAAAVRGPLAQPRGEVVLIASSFDQAKIAFEHTLAFLQKDIDRHRSNWLVTSTGNRAEATHKPTGVKFKARGSDPRRAHGLAPTLVLLDEPAQWPANTSAQMLAAVTTSLGKIEGARICALGTRPADKEHWFQKWLDGAADHAAQYAAADDDPVFAKKTQRKANPSLNYNPLLSVSIAAAAERAKLDTSALQSYKALQLNLGTSDTIRQMILDPEVWTGCESETAMREGPCVWGVDLGTSASMSAIAGYWPLTGWLQVIAAFPKTPDLVQRGNTDGVGNLYVRMAERGELIMTGGYTVDVAELLDFAFEQLGQPVAVVSDAWRRAELIDSLEASGLPGAELVTRRAGGPKDGGEDLRRFRRCAMEGLVHTPRSLLMRSAIAGAVAVGDNAANTKLARATEGQRRSHHRDDAIAASILAVAEGDRGRHDPSVSMTAPADPDPDIDPWDRPTISFRDE